MKNLKQLVSSVFLSLFLLFLFGGFVAPKVGAQGVNDFVIESFDASYKLSNKDKQGLLEVTETISLDYSGQNRGILRALPQTYEKQDLHPKILGIKHDGKTEPYITYPENDNTVVRIGDSTCILLESMSMKLDMS